MTTTTTRKRGTTLTLLDVSRIEDAAYAAFLLDNPDTKYTRLEVGFKPLALSDEVDGMRYVVCSEGVGWAVSDHLDLHLDLYGHGEGVFSMMPVMVARLDLAEVLACSTSDTVDLADLIRSFGARLETNFRLWADRLTPTHA